MSARHTPVPMRRCDVCGRRKCARAFPGREYTTCRVCWSQAASRVCRVCGVEQPIEAFHPTRQWRSHTCKSCVSAAVSARYAERRDAGMVHESQRETEPSRYCSRCYGMSWRRPRVGACACGEAYAPEPGEMHDAWQTREDPRWDGCG